MKKVLLAVTLLLVAASANAQWFDFSNNRQRMTVGFHGGESAHGTEYAGLGFGLGLSVMGVYVDFIEDGPEHQFDNRVNSAKYQDSCTYSINLGYQIPVLSWLRVMPMVGYSQTNYGITDAETVNIETDENSSRIYHDYNVTPGSRKHYFNFGAGLFVSPIRWLDIYAVASRNAIYGGLSFNFGGMLKKNQ